MARQIVISLVLFALPFILYAIYRLLVTDAEVDGRKTWPIKLLFGSGVVLALVGYSVMLAIALTTERDRNVCYEAARFEDGVLIPARQVPCTRDFTGVGMPASDDPGGTAQGVTRPGAQPASDEEPVDTDRPDTARPQDAPG